MTGPERVRLQQDCAGPAGPGLAGDLQREVRGEADAGQVRE